MKNRSHPPFWKYPIDCLDRVSQSEWCFFLVLGAIRCVARPYSGIGHDAQLYCLQAMNRAMGGFFNGDLFFLCGSQDSYSIFSILMAPLVAALGPAWSFMLVYTAAAAILWCAGTTAAFFFEDHLKGFGSFAEDRPHVEFVRQFIHEHRKNRPGAPTVYWPTDPTYVWFHVPAASFYSWGQTAGVVYHRGTAIEGQRRALLARSFEIVNLRKRYRRDVFRRHFSSFYQAGFDAPRPTRRDLIDLCREETLDFVVLRQKFGGLVAATNGAVFIYDCRSIRDKSIDVNQSTPPCHNVTLD